MARKYNPFAPVERSKVETPWGEFEIAPPNKERLAEIDALRREADKIADDADMATHVELGIRTASAGVDRGDELRSKLQEAWNAGDLTVEQVRGLAEFVGAEIAGEVDSGND